MLHMGMICKLKPIAVGTEPYEILLAALPVLLTRPAIPAGSTTSVRRVDNTLSPLFCRKPSAAWWDGDKYSTYRQCKARLETHEETIVHKSVQWTSAHLARTRNLHIQFSARSALWLVLVRQLFSCFNKAFSRCDIKHCSNVLFFSRMVCNNPNVCPNACGYEMKYEINSQTRDQSTFNGTSRHKAHSLFLAYNSFWSRFHDNTRPWKKLAGIMLVLKKVYCIPM